VDKVNSICRTRQLGILWPIGCRMMPIGGDDFAIFDQKHAGHLVAVAVDGAEAVAGEKCRDGAEHYFGAEEVCNAAARQREGSIECAGRIGDAGDILKGVAAQEWGNVFAFAHVDDGELDAAGFDFCSLLCEIG